MRKTVAVFALVTALAAEPARAQNTRDALAEAEQAYLDVDFERMLSRAEDALTAGGLTPERLVRVYQLLGIAAAALGDPQTAQQHFQRMLAIDPDARLPNTVPPRLRGPYLEARGVVSLRSERLAAEVGLARPQNSVRVGITDPFQVTRRVRVHARLEGAAEYTTVELPATREVMAPLEGSGQADRVEVWVELLDQYGNQVLTLGSPFEPRVIGRTAVAVAPAAGRSVFEEPAFWIVTAGVLVVAGAITAGVLYDQSTQRRIVTTVSIGF